MNLEDEVKELLNLIAEDLELLALLHDKELTKDLIKLLQDNDFPNTLGFSLSGERAQQALDLMRLGLNEIKDTDEKTLNNLAADYASIYLNHSISASPYESVWVDEDDLIMQDAMFDIRDWYKKYSLKVADWRIRSDDHFIHQFQFIAHVLKLNTFEDLKALAQFMDEHLFRWFDEFAIRVANRCDTGFYAGLAALSFCYIDEVRELMAKILKSPRPSKEEIEEKFKPAKPDESVQYIPGASVSW